jgi:hypothetical protein
MLFDYDLLVPLGPGGVSLMTAHARAGAVLVDGNVRILDVGLAGTMAAFAGEVFMLELRELLDLVRMAFFAGLPARKDGLAGGHLGECLSPVPAVLVEVTRNRVGSYDSHGEKEEPEDLGRHGEEASHRT